MAQATVKHKQLLIDVQALHTSVLGADWCHAEDHVVIQGMKYRKDWREKQNSLAKEIIEIVSLVMLSDLTDLEDAVLNTQQVINGFSRVIGTRIAEIEATNARRGLFSDFDTMKTRKTDLVARLSPLNNTLMERAPTAPKPLQVRH